MFTRIVLEFYKNTKVLGGPRKKTRMETMMKTGMETRMKTRMKN